MSHKQLNFMAQMTKIVFLMTIYFWSPLCIVEVEAITPQKTYLPSLTILFDTTIVQQKRAKAAVLKIVDELSGNKNIVIRNYTLIPFGQEFIIHEQISTTDVADFYTNAIRELNVTHVNRSTNTYHALKSTLSELQPPNWFMIIVTDSYPRNAENGISEILSALDTTQTKIGKELSTCLENNAYPITCILSEITNIKLPTTVFLQLICLLDDIVIVRELYQILVSANHGQTFNYKTDDGPLQALQFIYQILNETKNVTAEVTPKPEKEACESDIFTIINDNALQRNTKSLPSVVNSKTSVNSSSSNQLNKVFSLSIEELTTLSQKKTEQVAEDHLSLSSAYINLGGNIPTMLHDVKYSNLFHFENSSEITETIKMSPHAETFSIIYEAKLPELIINGKAKINGTCRDFILNISEPILKAVYEKENSASLGISPYSVMESFTLKGYYLAIKSNISSENQIFVSPNSQILSQLADSWLVTIFNAVNARFVKPKVQRQNHLLFETFRDSILEKVAVSIAHEFDSPPTFSTVTFVENENNERINNYTFHDVSVYNLKNFQNCFHSSQSLFLDRGGKNLYLHHVYFAFTYPSLTINSSPRVQYFSRNQLGEGQYNYNEYTGNRSTNENKKKTFNQFFIEQWSIKLLVFTDANGLPVADHETKINVHFETISFPNTLERTPTREQKKFIELFENSLAERARTYYWRWASHL